MIHPAAPLRPTGSVPGTPNVAVLPQLVVTRDRVIDALGSERRLIDELIGLMRRQRDAVAANDLAGVEESVHAVQRVLHTLGEARTRRRTLNVRFGHAEDITLSALEEALGALCDARFREARDGLQVAARTLSDEVALNRRILREALTAGNEFRVPSALPGAQPAILT